MQDVNQFEKYLNNIKLGIPLKGKYCVLTYIPSEEEDKADYEKFKEQQGIDMPDGECSLIKNFFDDENADNCHCKKETLPPSY